MKKIFLMLLPLVIGCVTVPIAEKIVAQRTSATIAAPKDKIWPLLVAEIAQHYPIQVIEKDSGLISTQMVQMPVGFNNRGMEQYIYPPRGFLATWEGLRMSMQIIAIDGEPGTTIVTINSHYEAYESNLSKSWVVAQSSGAVENQVLTAIEQKLNLK